MPPRHRAAWLRIFVVRCSLPCDPPVGGHSCNGGMIPRLYRAVCDLSPVGKSSECLRMTARVKSGKAQTEHMFCGLPPKANLTADIVDVSQVPPTNLCNCGKCRGYSLDQLVGAQQERFGNFQSNGLRGGEVDDKIEFSRLLDRDVGGLPSTKNLVDKFGGATSDTRSRWCDPRSSR